MSMHRNKADERPSFSVLVYASRRALYGRAMPGVSAVATVGAMRIKARAKLASLWLGFANILRHDSDILRACSRTLGDTCDTRLKPLFLDRAASTLAKHLRGWRLWISCCANQGLRPGAPSLEQLIDFL